MTLTHLSLFSGIGGLDLAAEWAGFRTVGQVEMADYPFRVLRRRFGRLPRWRGIKDVTEDALGRAGIARPTVISGGFPCQPFSVAGKRQGSGDDRHLWPEMLRVVRLARPAWVVGENVAGFVSMALDDVCADLEREGYSCRPFVFPAAGVGAPHQRDRVFIVAHSTRQLSHGAGRARGRGDEPTDCGSRVSDSERVNEDTGRSESGTVCRIGSSSSGLCDGEPDDADTDSHGCEGAYLHLRSRGSHETAPIARRRRSTGPDPLCSGREERHAAALAARAGFDTWSADPLGNLWLVEPSVGRVAAGISRRVDRLMVLGNAVVPQQAYPIFAAIAAIETGAMT